MMYSFDEIGLIPASISYTKSRKDVNPFDENGKLPLFVAPMTCILDESNYELFNEKVYPIKPVWYDDSLPFVSDGWVAVTLREFRNMAESDKCWDGAMVCVDTANGHMRELFELVKKFKDKNNDVQVMIGNIANPDTYKWCISAGVDYVRVSVGTGSGCTTSVQTGFHASLPWLLTEINTIKNKEVDYAVLADKEIPKFPKIVADGGINTISKAIKALALGADYVMCGFLFANCKESRVGCSHLYYGQSSMQGQIDRFGYVKSPSEGCEVSLVPSTTLDEFLANFESALRSAMSYADADNLSDFVGQVNWEPQTVHEFHSYNK